MTQLRFYTGGQMISLQAQPLGTMSQPLPAARGAGPASAATKAKAAAHRSRATAAPRAMRALHAQHERMAPLFHDVNEGHTRALVLANPAQGTVLVTETLVVGLASAALAIHPLGRRPEASRPNCMSLPPGRDPAPVESAVAPEKQPKRPIDPASPALDLSAPRARHRLPASQPPPPTPPG